MYKKGKLKVHIEVTSDISDKIRRYKTDVSTKTFKSTIMYLLLQ